MSGVSEFLVSIVSRLEQLDISYMIAGSFASSLYGEPRTTRDLDLVVRLAQADVEALLETFEHDEWYVDRAGVRRAVDSNDMFNVIDNATGWKVDFILVKKRPFSEMEFSRRKRTQIYGCDVWVASAEDTVLSKLEWSVTGGSARQVEDARAIVRRHDQLDLGYMRKWAVEIGVENLLADLI